LRFTRDKRGYETTALVHASRQRGRATQRILYWFRTPPGVKVGRPALDEDAIRWIEEHNPDIEFNWQKILEAQQPVAPPLDDSRSRRPRGKSERPPRDSGRRPDQQAGKSSPREEQPAAPTAQLADDDRGDREASFTEDLPVGDITDGPALDVTPLMEATPAMTQTSPPPQPPLLEDALEQITHPDAEERPPARLSPAESIAGKEQLIRLRARYSELQARISERGGEPGRVEELRGQAAVLNPDTWVTDEEARKGLLEFDSKLRELRSALGLKPRRRSRRGGRRRRRSGPPGEMGLGVTAAGANGQTDAEAEPSNSAGLAEAGEPDEKDGEDSGEP
jgi:hypothetical protein